jgi:hypothetical protein
VGDRAGEVQGKYRRRGVDRGEDLEIEKMRAR